MSFEFAQCKHFSCSVKIKITVAKLWEDKDYLSWAGVMENVPVPQNSSPQRGILASVVMEGFVLVYWWSVKCTYKYQIKLCSKAGRCKFKIRQCWYIFTSDCIFGKDSVTWELCHYCAVKSALCIFPNDSFSLFIDALEYTVAQDSSFFLEIMTKLIWQKADLLGWGTHTFSRCLDED